MGMGGRHVGEGIDFVDMRPVLAQRRQSAEFDNILDPLIGRPGNHPFSLRSLAQAAQHFLQRSGNGEIASIGGEQLLCRGEIHRLDRVGDDVKTLGQPGNTGLVIIDHRVRAMRPDLFHEVFIKSDLDVCESRDPKGLYKKARAGEIPEFTGISAPYEEPVAPELIVDTANQTVDQSIKALRDYISANLFQDRAVEVA